jgi:hypothetical protein
MVDHPGSSVAAAGSMVLRPPAGFVGQMTRRPQVPVPWSEPSGALRKGRSESGEAVRDRCPDLKLGDLAVNRRSKLSPIGIQF